MRDREKVGSIWMRMRPTQHKDDITGYIQECERCLICSNMSSELRLGCRLVLLLCLTSLLR